MEDLSSKFKSIFLDLLKCLTRLQWVLIFFSLINLSVSIYEDQIGKFDWKQSYVGRIKFGQFDTVSTAKRIIVATEENVLAALHLKTGQVVWRHVLENTPAGNIELLHVGEKVLTVTGSNPYLVRGWDPSTGVLLWEWSLALTEREGSSSKWFVQQGMLVHVLPVFGSHVEVTTYNMMTGQNKGATSKFPAAWANEDCLLTAPYYTCISKSSNVLMSLDVMSNAVQVLSEPLDQLLQAATYSIQPLHDNSAVPGFLLNSNKVVLIQENSFMTLQLTLSTKTVSATVINSADGLLLVEIAEIGKGYSLKAYNTKTSLEDPDLRIEEINIPTPKLVSVMCNRNANDQFVCRILLNGADDSASLMQQEGRMLWSREEALANVVAAEFVELPVSELDAAIESEFDQKEGSIWSAFVRRLTSQAHQLNTFLQTLLDTWSHGSLGDDSEPSQELELVRDYFNLHKIIVLVTKSGKVFGMDNLSGELLWRRYIGTMDTRKLSVFTRRTARHTAYDPRITIVARHRNTGNGLLVSLQPITGALAGEGVMHLDTPLLQVGLLPRADEEKLHAVLLLDADESVVVLPLSAAPLVENYYMYVADPETARVEGYALKYDGKTVNAIKTWSLTLGGDSLGHRLVAVAPKVPHERVHSPGRVLADRSVLYKYLNPNLLLFVTEGSEDVNKELLTATCVDAVSGAVVCGMSHRRARFASAALHAGNCIAYAVYNDKLRRTEIVTLELYEGSTRVSSSEEPFSSLKADTLGPRIQKQSYIAAPMTAAAFTFTERGITDKNVLMALTTGAIVEMPWAFLDPRRPISPSAEQREEGLIPYTPELPYPSESVINYNQTLERVSKIYTAASGLESTSLVLATGLDIFYTRVAPSKTFDLIKDDFEYFLIIVVLVALIAATYGTKYLAQKKLEKTFWE